MTGTAAGPGDRPLGISLLIWVFWFWTGAAVLLVLILAFGDGVVMVSGRAVPRHEALSALLPALIPLALAGIGAALALTLGRPWARPVALFPFALAIFGPFLTGVGRVSVAELVGAVALLLLVLGGLGWYLYGRPGPRAYFRRPPP